MRFPAPGSVIAVRALAVITLLIFASQLAVVLILWRSQETQRGAEFRLPLPGRAVAIVEAVEATPPEARPILLKALNGSDLLVRIEPELLESDAESGIQVDAFRRAINRYSDALAGRKIIGMVGLGDHPMGEMSESDTGIQASFPMRIIIEMNDGNWLVLETPNLMRVRLGRMPLGFIAVLAGFLVALLAVWIIWQEVRPVRAMAKAARQFAGTGKPSPVRPAGGRDVRALVNAFNAMQDRIAALLANRSLIMSAMSHDVRTYLTRLRLRIEALEPKSRQAAEKTLSDIQGLLDDTLAFAESGEPPEVGVPVDLARLLTAIAESGQFASETMSVEIKAYPIVRGNAGRLQRALVNIISNAIKYGERADITLRSADDLALITIADRGPGIPAGLREEVFEPFFRTDSSRNRNVEGTGLGLAIAGNIIRAHGGHIRLKDRTGGGLIALVELPQIIPAGMEQTISS